MNSGAEDILCVTSITVEPSVYVQTREVTAGGSAAAGELKDNGDVECASGQLQAESGELQ